MIRWLSGSTHAMLGFGRPSNFYPAIPMTDLIGQPLCEYHSGTLLTRRCTRVAIEGWDIPYPLKSDENHVIRTCPTHRARLVQWTADQHDRPGLS